jgi:dipeptidyl aminopeptidase/acylaminoacyl peptidase
MNILRIGALVGALLAFATAAAATPPIEDYGKLPAVEHMSLSPDGQNFVYVAVAGAGRRVVVQSVSGGTPPLALDAGASKLRTVKWLGNNHIAIVLSQTGVIGWGADKSEVSQTTVYNIKTHHAMIVFKNSSNKVLQLTFGEYGYALKNGQEYGYFGGITLSGQGDLHGDMTGDYHSLEHGYTDLFEVNLDTGDYQMVSGGSALVSTDWLVAPTGDVVAQTSYRQSDGQWRLYGHPAENHQLDQAQSALDEINLIGLGRTPKTVVVERADDSGGWSFWEYATDAPGKKTLLFDGRAVRRPVWDEHTGLLVGGWGDPTDPWVEFFDPALQKRYDAAKRAFKGLRVSPVSLMSNLDKLIVETEGPGDSGTYYFVDITNHHAEAIAWSYPTILQADVGDVRMFKYKAADGLDMEGVLTLPPGRDPKNLPVVVMPHGGPEAYDTTVFDWWAQAFASRGYAVFQPNYRGSSGYGKAFRDAGLGEWGRKMQTDVSDGLASLAKAGIVDPKRACIVGASYGGYAALAGVTVQHGLYRCAVSYGGVSDLNAMLAVEAQYRMQSATVRYWREFMGAKSNGDPAMTALSPARLAAKADAPVLVSYGTDDTVVPIDQSQSMAGALRGAGKPVEVLVLKDEDHWLSKPASRIQMVTASVAFVEKYNPPN